MPLCPAWRLYHHKHCVLLLQDSSQWASYRASLEKQGYFQGNIPGSAQHKQLLAQALHFFAQSEGYQQAAAAAAAPGEATTTILSQPADPQEFQVKLRALHLAGYQQVGTVCFVHETVCCGSKIHGLDSVSSTAMLANHPAVCFCQARLLSLLHCSSLLNHQSFW